MVQSHLTDTPKNNAAAIPLDGVSEHVDNAAKKRKQDDAFIALLAQIYKQEKHACYWNIPNMATPLEQPYEDQSNGIDAQTLLSRVKPWGKTAHQADCLITALELPSGFKTESLEIAIQHITADLSRCTDQPHRLTLNALAMALTASANANMREHGVIIEADSPQEVAALYAACRYIGLRVAEAPQIKKDILHAAQSNVTQCWEHFKESAPQKHPRHSSENKAASTPIGPIAMDTAENDKTPFIPSQKAADTTQPQDNLLISTAAYDVTGQFGSVTNIPADKVTVMDSAAYGRAYTEHPLSPTQKKMTPHFNAHAIGEDIAEHLKSLAIDTDLYKKIRKHVVETQDARRETLKNIFAKEGLTTRRITPIVQTLDMEGITSPQKKPGQGRQINFQPDGSAKPV